jgi:acetyl esterase
MTIDPQLAPFIAGLDALWPVSPLTLPVEVWRDKIEELAAATRQPYPAGLDVEMRMIDAPRPVRVRIYRPAADRPLPGLVYLHGGGWVIGSIDGHDGVTSALAADTPCVVVSVDYALAPEHPFPAAVEDARAAVRWTFENAGALGVDADTIFVGGDSAGGNLAAAMTLAFRGTPYRLRGQLLTYPCVSLDFSRPSFKTEANAPYLKTEEMVWFWDRYCPNEKDRGNPLAVPMSAPSLAGLPPALITVAEHDPLRDDGRAYAERLKAAGVSVTFRPGKGLIHGFIRTRRICDAAQAEHEAATAWLRTTAQS